MLLAVVTSLIGIYYYFRILIAMYLKSSERSPIAQVPGRHIAILAITVALSILFGVFPDLLVALI